MSSNLPSSSQALVPFTGYYPLSAVAGAFVIVDSVMKVQSGSASYVATVSISTDGLKSTQYPVDTLTLDNNTLVITDKTSPVARLTFSPAVGGTQVSGAITGYAGEAQGVSPFAAVDFAVWDGVYYTQISAPPGAPSPYVFVPTLQVKVDKQGNKTVWYAAGGAPLQHVAEFTYDFAMFVIAFQPEGGDEIIFEMGTSAQWGKVAGNAQDGQLLVSIQQQVPVIHL